MPLTDDTHVETIEEGGGAEEVSVETSIDLYFSLLREAQISCNMLMATAGRLNFDISRFKQRLEDWLEFNDVAATTPQIPQMGQGHGGKRRGEQNLGDRLQQEGLFDRPSRPPPTQSEAQASQEPKRKEKRNAK